ncbi:MAG: zinc ribbon domain-containing protein [Eubacterium sp.]
MICKNCGKELKETDKFCSKCGTEVELKTNENNMPTDAKNIDTQKKGICDIIVPVIIVAIILIIGFAGAMFIDANFNNGNIIYNCVIDIFSNDEKEIVGTWKLDTSSFGEGLDKLANLNGVITGIEFYSDGTCTVDGVSGPENGDWSIVDGQLKVQGTTGGMFWNYHGFISEYDLNGDTLTVYGDNGDNYVYYRE